MSKSKRSKSKRKFRGEKRHKVQPKTVALLKKVINMPAGGTGLPYVDASKLENVEVIPKTEGMLCSSEWLILSKPWNK